MTSVCCKHSYCTVYTRNASGFCDGHEPCENHPDRLAVYHIGGDTMSYDQVEFKPTHAFCQECRDNWRKQHMVIERT